MIKRQSYSHASNYEAVDLKHSNMLSGNMLI